MVRPLAHCPVLLPDAGSHAHTSAILPPTPITPQRKIQGLLYREIEQLQRIIQHGSPNKKSQLATQSRYSEEKRKKQTNKLLSSLVCSLRGSYQHVTQLFEPSRFSRYLLNGEINKSYLYSGKRYGCKYSTEHINHRFLSGRGQRAKDSEVSA